MEVVIELDRKVAAWGRRGCSLWSCPVPCLFTLFLHIIANTERNWISKECIFRYLHILTFMLNVVCFSWYISVAVWQGHARGSVWGVCAHLCIRICVSVKLQCHLLSLYWETWTKTYTGRFWERRYKCCLTVG